MEEVSESILSIYTVKLKRASFLRPVPVRGAGSGFVIDEQGHILTNHHVIEGMDKAKMVLPTTEKEIGGKVIGRDPENDLAIIKANDSNLQPLEFADSSKVKAGQPVLALGNALGFKGAPTASHGIISAPSRTIRSKRKIFEDLIQTDAAINPGNSGGPLLNMDGKVIGVNTAMIPMAHGMAFAIPSNIAQHVSEQIIQYGEVKRPWLGVTLISMNPRIAREIGTKITKGALVVKTGMRSPASQAGIRKGHLIRKVDDVTIRSSRDVQDVIASKNIGEEVKITTVHRGKKQVFNVTLESPPQ